MTQAMVEQAVDRALQGAAGLAEVEAATLQALRDGTAAAALAPLRRLAAAHPQEAVAWRLLGTVLHHQQAHEEAMVALDHAVALAPADGRAALALAQLRYETGRPAATRFERLATGAPPGPLVAGWAGALAAEARVAEADALLARALAVQPGWREGQARLASLRQTMGRPDYDAGYAAACRRLPGDLALRMDWFQLLAKAKRWADATAVRDAAERDFGAQPRLAVARLYLLSESGEAAGDPALFDAVAGSADPGLAIARIRHALRGLRPDAAARLAEPFLAGPAAAAFWPYAALAWRLLGDARADWLDRPDALVRVHDLGLSTLELAELAELLRSLHVMAAPYLGQSVRGGTQTDRPLLFRHEPIMRRARAAITAAVEAHVAGLPPAEPGHPLLGTPRGPIRFAGSWSVRLAAQGFHASHTHPAGWLSSAAYVALPDPLGPAPAGALLLGTPPPELALDLEPYRVIPPVAGRLVLFPATMWHGTAPFADGERLTIAFDVGVPPGG